MASTKKSAMSPSSSFHLWGQYDTMYQYAAIGYVARKAFDDDTTMGVNQLVGCTQHSVWLKGRTHGTHAYGDGIEIVPEPSRNSV